MVPPLSEARSPVAAAVAAVTRDSYGRLLALLAAPGRDIAAAEDALADALERALTRWETDGIPGNPQAWVLVVARNRLRDTWKSAAHRLTASLDENTYEVGEFAAEALETSELPDRDLEMVLVCALTAIAPSVRA